MSTQLNDFETKLSQIISTIIEKEEQNKVSQSASPSASASAKQATSTSQQITDFNDENTFKDYIEPVIDEIYKRISNEMRTLTVKNRVPDKDNINYIISYIQSIKTEHNKNQQTSTANQPTTSNYKLTGNEIVNSIFNKIMEKYYNTNTNNNYIAYTDIKTPIDEYNKNDYYNICDNKDTIECEILDYYITISFNLKAYLNEPENTGKSEKILKVLKKEIKDFYKNIINNKYRIKNAMDRLGNTLTEKFIAWQNPNKKRTSKLFMSYKPNKLGKPHIRGPFLKYVTEKASGPRDVDEQFANLKGPFTSDKIKTESKVFEI